MTIIKQDKVIFCRLQLCQNVFRSDVSVEYFVLLHFEEDSRHISNKLLYAVNIVAQFLIYVFGFYLKNGFIICSMNMGADVKEILGHGFQVVVKFIDYPKVIIVLKIVNIGLQIGA